MWGEIHALLGLCGTACQILVKPASFVMDCLYRGNEKWTPVSQWGQRFTSIRSYILRLSAQKHSRPLIHEVHCESVGTIGACLKLEHLISKAVTFDSSVRLEHACRDKERHTPAHSYKAFRSHSLWEGLSGPLPESVAWNRQHRLEQ
jgi:hypothetical protein